MSKKKDNADKPNVHDKLKGFDIKVNEFGEIVTNYNIDKLNEFLDENVEDKKLVDKKGKGKDEEE